MTTSELLRRLPRHRAIVFGLHLALFALAYLLAFVLLGDLQLTATAAGRLIETLPYLVGIRLILAHRFGLDRGIWQHVGLRDFYHLAAATTAGSVLFPAVLLLVDKLDGLPASVFLLDWLLATALPAGARVIARELHERRQRGRAGRGRRTLIVGAGDAGAQLLRQILHAPEQGLEVVGLVDDDPETRDRLLHGVPVLGTLDELRGVAAVHRATLALIAIPSATPEQLRRVVDRCAEADLEVKLLPPLKDLVAYDVQVSNVREVAIEDLLGRDPVHLDLSVAAPDLAGQVVLVTGAGGSIGSELVRQIARFHPLRLILVDRAESPLCFTHLEVSAANPEIDVVPVLASVTNADRMQTVCDTYRPSCVFHAAAYKHVPMLEWNAIEGVWNNVIGTLRIARCAARAGARKFVLISTDKAVNPTSILGATKLIAERIVLELPSLRTSDTDFRVVRFGNVLGSDGSVVPLFKRQIAAGGPVTVTHPEVRRYFMTIPEATQLVLQAAALPEAAGRIALLEMGEQVRILDLAEQLIRLEGRQPHRDVQIVYTGLRPGEKLAEELLAETESAAPTSVAKIRVVERNGTQGAALAKRLRHLIQVAVRREESAVLRALAALAPEYGPPLSEPSLHRNGARSVARAVAGTRVGRFAGWNGANLSGTNGRS